MKRLEGKVAWVTGAGTGIGEAAAVALAGAGATVVLTGRRAEPLQAVAARLATPGHVRPGDMTASGEVAGIAGWIQATLGRLDVFVANAGLNIPARDWSEMTAEGADTLIEGNLSSAFYGVIAVLPIMRAQRDGVLIHTASMAGRFIGGLSGAGYTAAKHGVVAMSHTINMQECIHGIRSTAVLPGEVETPILDARPVPVSAADRAGMLRPEDVGDLVLYVACLPKSVVINEVMICPTWNRGYVAALGRQLDRKAG